MISPEEFDFVMQARGWVLFESVVDDELLDRIPQGMAGAYERCREVQTRNGVLESTTGTSHHVVGVRDSLDDFLRRRYLLPYIERYLGGKCILNSYGAFTNEPTDAGYFNAVHRDVRSFNPGPPLMLNLLVMVDEFTLANGATYMLTGSQHVEAKPSDEIFYRYAERLIGPRGSIALFDSRLWHAAGRNTTQRARRILTQTFTRPFYKSQVDYPRFVSAEYAATLDEEMRQLLGFNARMPASLDEWYQPPEKRYYKKDQG